MKKIFLLLFLIGSIVVNAQQISLTELGTSILDASSYNDAKNILISNGFSINTNIENDSHAAATYGEYFINTKRDTENVLFVNLCRCYNDKTKVERVSFEFYSNGNHFRRLASDMDILGYKNIHYKPEMGDPDDVYKNGIKTMLFFQTDASGSGLCVEFMNDKDNRFK